MAKSTNKRGKLPANIYQPASLTPATVNGYVLLASAILVLSGVAAVRQGDESWAAVVFLLVLAIWNAFIFCTRLVVRLELNGPILKWKSATRTHEVEVSSIRRVRPFSLVSRLIVFETNSTLPFLVWAGPDFQRFASVLNQKLDGVTVHVPKQRKPEAKLKAEAKQKPKRSSKKASD